MQRDVAPVPVPKHAREFKMKHVLSWIASLGLLAFFSIQMIRP